MSTTIGEMIDEGKRYVINFFGYCNTEKHDKVWGWATLGRGQDRVLYNFWCRRGGTMKFKRHATEWGDAGLHRETEKKCRPRSSGQYRSIPIDQIDTVWPDFATHFEKQLFLAKLFDNIRREKEGMLVTE